MAKLTYQSLQNNNVNNNFGKTQSNIGYFSLKDNGDSAIVRIMEDSIENFDLLSIHTLNVDGKFKKISCIRPTGKERIDDCPLCKAGLPIQKKFYVHLIEYTYDENGNLVGLPKIWERPISYAKKISDYIDDYGDLSNYIIKIKRNGVAGAKDVTYTEIFMPDKDKSFDVTYPKQDSAFNDFDVATRLIKNYSFDELDAYVETGKLPETQKTIKDTAQVATPKYTKDNAVAQECKPVVEIKVNQDNPEDNGQIVDDVQPMKPIRKYYY